MTDVKEEWICTKFYFKLGKMAAETHKVLKEAFGDNALSQMQTYEWFRRPKKARQFLSNVKSMSMCFIDIEGIVHKDFVPPGQTLNGKFYWDILRWLRENIQRKHPDKWQTLLDLASGQCSGSCIARCVAIFSFYQHDSHLPPSLLTGPHSLWFFPIPKDEIEAQGATFWQHWRDPDQITGCDEDADA